MALVRLSSVEGRLCPFVVDADLKSYFDTIPHDRLMALVEGSISDSRVLSMFDGFLRQEIMSDVARRQPTAGTPDADAGPCPPTRPPPTVRYPAGANRSSISASVRFNAPPCSASMTLATMARFLSFRTSIFSSIVPSVTSR